MAEGKLRVTIDQVATAFRVRWTHGGTTTERIVVPRNDGATSKIDLWWIPAPELAGGRLQLVAIRFDRSEVAVEGVPDQLVHATSGFDIAMLVALTLALLLAPASIPVTAAIGFIARLPVARVVHRKSCRS